MLSLNFQFKWKIFNFKKKTFQFVYHYTCFSSFRLMYCWGNRQSNRLSRIQIYVYLVQYRTLVVIHFMNGEWVCYIMRRTIFNVYICLNHSWWCKHRAYFRHLLRVVTACNAFFQFLSTFSNYKNCGIEFPSRFLLLIRWFFCYIFSPWPDTFFLALLEGQNIILTFKNFRVSTFWKGMVGCPNWYLLPKTEKFYRREWTKDWNGNRVEKVH